MRAAAELVEGSGRPKKLHTERAISTLSDLVTKRPTQRATDWHRLNVLTADELDAILGRPSCSTLIGASAHCPSASRPPLRPRVLSRRALPFPHGVWSRVRSCV